VNEDSPTFNEFVDVECCFFSILRRSLRCGCFSQEAVTGEDDASAFAAYSETEKTYAL